jgi:hypothetical protein
LVQPLRVSGLLCRIGQRVAFPIALRAIVRNMVRQSAAIALVFAAEGAGVIVNERRRQVWLL